MRIPTVMIEGADGNPVVINQDEFDATKHKLYGSAGIVDAALQQTPPVVQPAAPVATDANGNPVNAGDGGQMVPPAQTVALRTDGPTVAEYVAAGYDPKNYPPAGYESRSTVDEINAAITAKAPAELMLVTKKGKKFIVVNLAGEPIAREGINPDGYASEEDANTAITAVNTPAPAANA